jgi:hypothetical protein
MSRESVVFVKCQLSRGSVPTQCLFRVDTISGMLHGIAPLHYCYTTNRQRLDAAPPSGSTNDGLLVGIEWSRPSSGVARVELPDGELYDVNEDLIFPAETPDRVPIES